MGATAELPTNIEWAGWGQQIAPVEAATPTHY